MLASHTQSLHLHFCELFHRQRRPSDNPHAGKVRSLLNSIGIEIEYLSNVSRWVPSNTWKNSRRRSNPMWFASCSVSAAGRWEFPLYPISRWFNRLPVPRVCLAIGYHIYNMVILGGSTECVFFHRADIVLWHMAWPILCLAIHSLNFAESASI